MQVLVWSASERDKNKSPSEQDKSRSPSECGKSTYASEQGMNRTASERDKYWSGLHLNRIFKTRSASEQDKSIFGCEQETASEQDKSVFARKQDTNRCASEEE